MIEAAVIIGLAVLLFVAVAVAATSLLGALGYRQALASALSEQERLRGEFEKVAGKAADYDYLVANWRERQVGPGELEEYCRRHPGEKLVVLMREGKTHGSSQSGAAGSGAVERGEGAGAPPSAPGAAAVDAEPVWPDVIGEEAPKS